MNFPAAQLQSQLWVHVSLRTEERYSQTRAVCRSSCLSILLTSRKTKEHRNLRNCPSSAEFIGAVVI